MSSPRLISTSILKVSIRADKKIKQFFKGKQVDLSIRKIYILRLGMQENYPFDFKLCVMIPESIGYELESVPTLQLIF